MPAAPQVRRGRGCMPRRVPLLTDMTGVGGVVASRHPDNAARVCRDMIRCNTLNNCWIVTIALCLDSHAAVVAVVKTRLCCCLQHTMPA